MTPATPPKPTTVGSVRGVVAPADGQWLFISGLTARLADGTLVAEGDVVGQTRQILDNLATILDDAGGHLGDVARLVVYVVEGASMDSVGQVCDARLGSISPAVAYVSVTRLYDAQQLVEIEATALIPRSSEPVSQPSFTTLGAGPVSALQGGRGTMQRLVGPEQHAISMDAHVNTLNVDSGLGTYHVHDRAENLYVVLDGTLEVLVGTTRRRLEPGQVAFIPPGVGHAAGSDGRGPVRVLEIYAPAGPDFREVPVPPVAQPEL